MSGKLQVTLVRSRSKADWRQRRVLDGLGLRRRERPRELPDDPSIRGMIERVHHLVRVEKA